MSELIPVNMGDFSTVKQLRDHLDRALKDNRGKDIHLDPAVTVSQTYMTTLSIETKIVPATKK